MQRTATPFTSVRFRSQPPINMKILITGSSGFIGFSLAKKLLEQDLEVIGIDNHNDYYDVSLKERRKNKLEGKNFKFFNQDINELDINETKIDVAINLAAQAGVRLEKGKEYLYEQTNIEGFKKFCKFCINQNITNIIYASSSSVYSDQKKNKFKEDTTTLHPKSLYGISKLKNEEHATYIAKNFPVSILGLRFFSVYGPYGRPDMAYYHFCKMIDEEKPITLFNNGKMLRDMTYIDDLTSGIIGAIDYILEKNKVNNEIFNLGNSKPVSTKYMLNVIENKLQKTANIINSISENESIYTNADITKAKKFFSYKPKVNVEDGLGRFISWYKKFKKNE